MDLIIYDILFVLMLFVLYRSGQELSRSSRIMSEAGIMGIAAYTLNEGLRFGRGIDYNLYGMTYEDIGARETGWELGFNSLAEMLTFLDIPWQGFVMLMSFFYIVALMTMLKYCKDVVTWALPLFVMLSRSDVENMVRWFMGFSFIMVGIYYLFEEGKKSTLKFFIWGAVSLLFHKGLFPIPFAIYFISKIKKPIMNPFITLALFFSISFIFKTEFMLQFVQIANMLILTSDRFDNYGNDLDYWLTGGNAGTTPSVLPDIQELLFLCMIVVAGYYAIQEIGRKYIFSYNMYIIGFLLYPIARQIELVYRFDAIFMFFRAIVLAQIIYVYYINKTKGMIPAAYILCLLIMLNIGRRELSAPLKGSPEHYLYVWNSGNRSYQQMYDMWIDGLVKSDSKRKK